MASMDEMVVTPREPSAKRPCRKSKQHQQQLQQLEQDENINTNNHNNNKQKVQQQRRGCLVDLTQDDVTLYHRLGSGASGEVFVSVIRPTRQAAAVKLVSKLTINSRSDLRIRREARIQALLDHPHICKLYSHIETETHHCHVMQYARNGDLLQLLRSGGRLPFPEVRRLMKQLVSAVSHMHRKGFVHRDIKPENILLDHKGDVLLADFGFACKWAPNRFQRDSCGSLHYAAPEVVRNELVRGPEADVWSCGAVFVAMLTASLPFNGKNGYETLGYMESRGFVRTSAMTADEQLWDLLCGMLEPDVEQRLTLKQVRKHPWMKQGSKKKSSSSSSMSTSPSTSSSSTEQLDIQTTSATPTKGVSSK